jgi:hypothetical protein
MLLALKIKLQKPFQFLCVLQPLHLQPHPPFGWEAAGGFIACDKCSWRGLLEAVCACVRV